MKKLLLLAILAFIFSSVQTIHSQDRKSVSAAEVNGTFRDYFGGKYKDSYNEIKILALGGGKLRVAFELVYPYTMANGEPMANTGTAEGTATIEGDTATFTPPETEGCTITIKFVKRGTIEVSQEGVSDCGFGFNVNSQGNYKKSSGGKPKFSEQ